MLYERCCDFGQNPADEFGLEEEWVRWCFNNAIWTFGRTVRNKYDEFDADKKTGERKRKWTLEQILEGYAFGRLQQMSAAFLLSGQHSMDI